MAGKSLAGPAGLKLLMAFFGIGTLALPNRPSSFGEAWSLKAGHALFAGDELLREVGNFCFAVLDLVGSFWFYGLLDLSFLD